MPTPLSSVFFLLYRVELMPLKFGEIACTVTESAAGVTLAFGPGGVYFAPIWGDELFRGLRLPEITASGLTHLMRGDLTRFDPQKPGVKMSQTGILFYNESNPSASLTLPKGEDLLIFI